MTLSPIAKTGQLRGADGGGRWEMRAVCQAYAHYLEIIVDCNDPEWFDLSMTDGDPRNALRVERQTAP